MSRPVGRPPSPLAVPGIYTVTHVASGKVYFGRSTNCRQRINNHQTELRDGRHHNRYLQRAWKKYGEAAFVWAVWTDLSGVPREEMAERLHQAEAAARIAFPAAYNIAEIEPARAYHAPETLELMAAKREAAWNTDQYRANVLPKMRQAAARPESRQAKSKSLSETKNRPEEIAKSAARTAELWADPDYAQRVTAANRKAKATPEYLAAHSVRMKETRNRPEAKAALSARMLEYWDDPALREAQSARTTALNADPAFRAIADAATRKSWEENREARRAALLAANARPEVKAKRAEANRRRAVARRAAKAATPSGAP